MGATFMILIVSMMLVSARQYIGDPINCIAEGVPGGTMDLYCWIHSTFSVPSRWGKYQDEYGKGGAVGPAGSQPHPGVAPIEESEKDDIVHHKYYQWVVFFLFVQALFFYMPRLIWKSAEGGLMKMLVRDLTNPALIVNKTEREDRVAYIVKYFRTTTKTHGGYALNFFFCEVLALANVVGQIYFTDRFLGYTFTTYGWDVATLATTDPEARADPMNVVFPKVAKCTFHKYGPSGTIQNHDGLCILALNIINEKIYVFLWFWMVGLAIVSALALLYRILIIASPSMRISVIYYRAEGVVDKRQISATLNIPNHGYIQQLGDYLILYLITKNLSPFIMKDVFDAIAPQHYSVPLQNATEEEKEPLKQPAYA